MLKKSACLFAGVMCLALASQAQAFDWFGGRLSIGGGYGRAKPKLPYSYQDTYQDGEMWTGHMKYFLNNNFSVVASYADLEPYRRGDKQDFYRFRPIVGSLRYNIFHHLPVSPYLTAGAGYSINKHEAPGIVADKWEGFTWQGGLGLEFFITEGTSLGAEALYHHFAGGSDVSPYSPYRLISAVGTINFYFGPGPSKKRAEEALAKEKAATEQARAEAEAAKAQAAEAQKGQTAAQEAAAASAAQVAQAQAEIDEIKKLVVNKEINPITFKTGRADLLAESNATLDKVSAIAKKYPRLKLRIEGHTDSTGSQDTNQTLSQKRADAVKTYLTDKDGIPADEMTAIGFGSTRPIASNATSEGRAQNRRVEFIFALP